MYTATTAGIGNICFILLQWHWKHLQNTITAGIGNMCTLLLQLVTDTHVQYWLVLATFVQLHMVVKLLYKTITAYIGNNWSERSACASALSGH